MLDQSRLPKTFQRHLWNIRQSTKQVRHCSSSTVLRQKYPILVLGTYVENISAEVLHQLVARCPRSARLPSSKAQKQENRICRNLNSLEVRTTRYTDVFIFEILFIFPAQIFFRTFMRLCPDYLYSTNFCTDEVLNSNIHIGTKHKFLKN